MTKTKPKTRGKPAAGKHHSTNNKSDSMDKVNIKRVKRNKKEITAKEKILAGLGVGGALMGGISAVAPKSESSKFVRTTEGQDSSSGKIKSALKGIFGVQEAKAMAEEEAPTDVTPPEETTPTETPVEAPVETPAETPTEVTPPASEEAPSQDNAAAETPTEVTPPASEETPSQDNAPAETPSNIVQPEESAPTETPPEVAPVVTPVETPTEPVEPEAPPAVSPELQPEETTPANEVSPVTPVGTDEFGNGANPAPSYTDPAPQASESLTPSPAAAEDPNYAAPPLSAAQNTPPQTGATSSVYNANDNTYTITVNGVVDPNRIPAAQYGNYINGLYNVGDDPAKLETFAKLAQTSTQHSIQVALANPDSPESRAQYAPYNIGQNGFTGAISMTPEQMAIFGYNPNVNLQDSAAVMKNVAAMNAFHEYQLQLQQDWEYMNQFNTWLMTGYGPQPPKPAGFDTRHSSDGAVSPVTAANASSAAALSGTVFNPQYTAAGSTGGYATQKAPPPAGVTFTSTGSTTNPQVGEKWTIIVTGKPGEVVYSTARGTTTPMGTIGSDGRLILSGSFTANDLGDWEETWKVGDTAIANPVKFTVKSIQIQDANIAATAGTYQSKIVQNSNGTFTVTLVDANGAPVQTITASSLQEFVDQFKGLNIPNDANSQKLFASFGKAYDQISLQLRPPLSSLGQKFDLNASGYTPPAFGPQYYAQFGFNPNVDLKDSDAVMKNVAAKNAFEAYQQQLISDYRYQLAYNDWLTYPNNLTQPTKPPGYDDRHTSNGDLKPVTPAIVQTATALSNTVMPQGGYYAPGGAGLTGGGVVAGGGATGGVATGGGVVNPGAGTGGVQTGTQFINPTLTAISASQGLPGSQLVLMGTNINTTTSGNLVEFWQGSVLVSSVSPSSVTVNSLTVAVPNIPAGSYDVRFRTGLADNQISNFSNQKFTVLKAVATKAPAGDPSSPEADASGDDSGATGGLTGGVSGGTGAGGGTSGGTGGSGGSNGGGSASGSGTSGNTGSLASSGLSAPVLVDKILPIAPYGAPYTAAITATGSSALTYSVQSGSLPPGLSMNSSGVITGTATSSNPNVVMPYTFTVKVTDANGLSATAQFTISVGTATGGGTYYTGGSGATGGGFRAQVTGLQMANLGQGSQVAGVNTFQGLQMPDGYLASNNPGLQMPAGIQQDVQAPQGQTAYTVKKGDTLWAIAKKYYGDGKQWRKILEANLNQVKNPKALKVGTVLVIPGK